MELKIEYLPIDNLKPYKNNARKHADKDLSTIIASINEFGFDDPIGIWSDDNIIVEGHGRLLAAQKLGLKEVPCIRLDHLTDEQRRAYALAHNKTAEMSEWDFDILDFELGEIELDMSDFGFEDACEIEFADFDGQGDGGGSMMATGTKVRVVIGAVMCDIEDPTHEIYAKTKELNPDTVAAWVAEKILSGEMQ
jgi:hypothetical protein